MPTGVQPLAPGLDTVHGHLPVCQEGMEQAHCIGAAADTGHQRIRQLVGLVQALGPGLPADDALEVAHQHRVGVRAGHAADDVEGAVHIQ